MLGEKSFRPLRKAPWTFSTQNPTRAKVPFSAQFRDGAQGSSAPDARRPNGPGARPPAGQHGARGDTKASARGKRKSPKRFCPLTSVLIGARGDTKASARGKRKSPKRFCPLTSVLIGGTEVFRTRLHASRQQFPSLFEARHSLMDEAVRKPASKSSPCPRASSRSVLTGRRPCNPPAPPRDEIPPRNNLEDAETAGPAGQAGTQWSRRNEIPPRNNLDDAEIADSAGQAGTQWSGRDEISLRNNLNDAEIDDAEIAIRQGKTGRNGRDAMRF